MNNDPSLFTPLPASIHFNTREECPLESFWEVIVKFKRSRGLGMLLFLPFFPFLPLASPRTPTSRPTVEVPDPIHVTSSNCLRVRRNYTGKEVEEWREGGMERAQGGLIARAGITLGGDWKSRGEDGEGSGQIMHSILRESRTPTGSVNSNTINAPIDHCSTNALIYNTSQYYKSKLKVRQMKSARKPQLVRNKKKGLFQQLVYQH
ncbi:hypothetical protein BDQ17DRAFT_1334380 [Cyathus striatus]|nr:hypothetical protein BDQ17DRAFT_1334380 [Cyathus striatus]